MAPPIGGTRRSVSGLLTSKRTGGRCDSGIGGKAWRGARRSVGEMKHVCIRLAAGVLAVGSIAACSSSDDGNDPTPVGGINGPARVDPDSGGANNGEGDD